MLGEDEELREVNRKRERAGESERGREGEGDEHQGS